MRSDLVLSARIESIIWEALVENDLHMRLSARETFAAELVELVRDQQAEAWGDGYMKAVANGNDHWGAHELNPYRQETEA